jgi:hypothetical protein
LEKNVDYKYRRNNPNVLCCLDNLASPFWKGVLWSMQTSQMGIMWKIVNGQKGRFWKTISLGIHGMGKF